MKLFNNKKVKMTAEELKAKVMADFARLQAQTVENDKSARRFLGRDAWMLDGFSK